MNDKFWTCVKATLILAAAIIGPINGIQAAEDQISESEVWNQLRNGGNVLLLRHAQTNPGFGDPAGFRLGECETQRNLSAAGREQSRRIGERIRAEGVEFAAVYSSEWCRCYETASLAFGAYELWPALNSFFQDGTTRDSQTREVAEKVRSLNGNGNMVLVTHQVNITALTGVWVSQGEGIVVRGGPNQELRILGRIKID